MSENKHISKKEIEELDEIYRQKHKNGGKKAKPEKKSAHTYEKPVAEKPSTDSTPTPKKQEVTEKSEPVNIKAEIPEKPQTADDPQAKGSESPEKPKSDKPKKKKASGKKELSPEEQKKIKTGNMINIIACTLFFVITAVCLVVMERPTKSESEKRELAKFPEFSWESYWSGKYTSDISNFFNDTVPNRDLFKQMGANFRTMFGFSLDGIVISGDITQIDSNVETEITTQSTKPILIVTPAPSTDNDNSSAPAPESSEDSSVNTDDTSGEQTTPAPLGTFPTPVDENAEIIYSEGLQTVFRSNGTLYAAQLYYGDRKYAEGYAKAVNSIKEMLPSVNVYNMTYLTQNTFLIPANINRGTYSEQSDCTYLTNMLSSDIINISSLDALAPHADEEIFFLRDCHWTQLGAYYAAESLAKAAGVPFADKSSYEEKQRDCLGSVYNATRWDGLMWEGEIFRYFIPQNEYTTEYYNKDYELYFENYPLLAPESDYNPTSFYSTYMVSEDLIKHVYTDCKNGRRLMVLKDDYPSAMIPCLTSSFEEIIVIDVRYCGVNPIELARDEGITDIMVGMTTENALGYVGTYLDYIINM